jgi:hypothetical protein
MSRDWTADDILEKDVHSSVTRKRLTNTRRGFGLSQKIGLLQGWLYDEPFIEYLDDGEVPYYLFVTSEPVTEAAVGQEHDLTPKDSYSTLIGLTQSRVLIVIAREPTDETREIPYSDIERFAIQPSSNLGARTSADGKPVEPSTHVRFEFDTSRRTISYYSGQSLTVSEILDGIGQMLQRHIDHAEWTQKMPWIEARTEFQNATREYEQWLDTVNQRAKRAEDKSITTSRVKEIWDHLSAGEQPHYYGTGTEHRHHIVRSHGQGPADSFSHRWSVFTDERIIINNRSTSFELRYPNIFEFTFNERTREQGETTDTVIQLDIETSNEYHIVDIESFSQAQLSNLARFIREKCQ